MNAGSGFSALMVRKHDDEQQKPDLFRILIIVGLSGFRCDSHHLCGSEQQLQHGDQRRQFHQSAARISGPFQIDLDQQVHQFYSVIDFN